MTLKSPLSDAEIEQLAQQLGKVLLQHGATITLAESCTGGGIAQAITAVPGSSQWFEYGFVTYANQAKQQLLGVEDQVLQQQGAVSQPVVEQMALGAIIASGADYAIAVSGIAGPDGGTAEKPVGTVWIYWATPTKNHSKRFRFAGDRRSIREQAIKISLQELLHQIIE
jgi:nicotinamide-nucleotide amidase